MRRAPIVLTATVIGTAGVLLFKPLSTAAVGTTAVDTGSATSGAGSTDTGSVAASTPSASASASSSSSSARSSSGTTATGGTYTGAAETTRFGTTQVRVTVKSGKITGVAAIAINQNDPRSVQISENAVPTLRSEVLAKQTAAVDTVSGATYTSAAYEASLQSALDTAGFAAADGSKASTDLSTLQEQGGR